MDVSFIFITKQDFEYEIEGEVRGKDYFVLERVSFERCSGGTLTIPAHKIDSFFNKHEAELTALAMDEYNEQCDQLAIDAQIERAGLSDNLRWL